MAAAQSRLPLRRLNDTRRRIHRAIDFIDENLDRDHALGELADIACMSRFHFQRVYRGMVGESPAETVRRLRLLRARDSILFDAASPAEAAAIAGFARLASFERAYRAQFDRDAGEIRPISEPLPRPEPLSRFTIVDRKTTEMGATSYAGERAAMDPLMTDAQTYARYLTSDPKGRALAVYHDDFLTPYDRPFRADLCFTVNGPLDGEAKARFAAAQVPGGTYACVEQRGLLFDLLPYWQNFENRTLAQAGWRRRSGPVLRWLFSDRAITPPSQRLAYLYIPVEAVH